VGYSLDTNVLISAWGTNYPPDLAPGYWEQLEQLARDGTVVCSREVLEELAKKESDLHSWAKARPYLFVELDGDQMVATSKILGKFSRLTMQVPNRGRADPWVIALAMTRQLTVVTEESYGNEKRPRIPMACDHFDVPWVRPVDFMRALSFRLSG
jgi:hypothetical protein